MPDQTIDNPFFARMYERLAPKMEKAGATEHRARTLVGLEGRVIEVGAGNGMNFPHYPEGVTEVVAVEPENRLRASAVKAAASASVPIEVVAGLADALPVEDGSFDAAVASLVLCSVADQPRAIAELHRVVKPGGDLRFYEHVVANHPFRRGVQHFATRTFWPHVAGGCHLDRDTTAAIRDGGFEIEALDRFGFSPSWFEPEMPHILGRARRS